jgi:FkbM family methyltransferase
MRVESALRVIASDGAFSQVEAPFGNLWMPARDISGVAETILDAIDGIYQPGDKGVRAGDTVLDCGANIGIYTRYALSKGAARVIAIEVAPEDIECLRRNFQKEVASGTVVIYPKGVWHEDATLELVSSPNLSSMANSVRPLRSSEGARVRVTTIDQVVTELKLDRVDFIKMDIEGAEANALLGATATLTRFKPRLAIALEHNRSDPDRIPRLVNEKWPFYSLSFSRCAEKGGGARIQPAVLYAH